MPKSVPKLITSILICQAAGVIGSLFTISAISTWYPTLNQPYFRPPNSLFAPVWTILYTLIGISLYLILIKPLSKKRTEALKLFALHLVLNALWSIVFFGLHQIFLALVIIIVMVVTLVFIMKKFLSLDSRASGVLFPYLVWISFAMLLNFAFWILN
jgi:translocator protein